MAIGLWQDIEFNEVMRLLGYVVMISMLICFGLYFLFYFVVSKERSYLWISITLLVGLYPFITWILSSTFGVRFNYLYGAIGLSIMSIVLIKFFQNLLSFKQIFPKTYNIYKTMNITIHHVKAHTQNDDEHSYGNRMADKLATSAL